MTKWTKYDVADYLDTEDARKKYLDAAMEIGDPLIIQAAIGDVARAKGMSSVSEESGLSRENLYRSLSGEKDAYFSTIVKVLDVLGYRVEVARKATA